MGSTKKTARQPGLSPGELKGFRHTNNKEIAAITLLRYNPNEIEETTVASIQDMVIPDSLSNSVYWYNVDGVNNPDQLAEIQKKYHLHPLLMEDIASAEQRPKLDDYGDYLFLTLKMIRHDKEKKHVVSEQLSIVLGPNLILSFQENEKEGDVFDPNRERLRQNKGRIRSMHSDYLMYSLLDTVVDHYFNIIERVGDKLEVIEQEMLTDPKPEKLRELYRFRRELVYLRKSVWPLREVIVKLERDECHVISNEVRPFLRDVYDHTIQVIDAVESYRDILTGIVDLYLSSVSNKMNSVMKVLTIISTIFMPLAFITGVYGMNFDNMPELHTKYGYFAVLTGCLISVCGMLLYFKRKNWL